MLSRFTLYFLVALAGAALTMQMAWNLRLRTATGSPVLSTLISVVVTLITLLVVWLSGTTSRGTVPPVSSLPWWAWCGGVLAGFYLLTALIALPKLGAAPVFSLIIAGQMMAALYLDSTGAFGVPLVAFSLLRLLGVVLLVAGVVLIQKS